MYIIYLAMNVWESADKLLEVEPCLLLPHPSSGLNQIAEGTSGEILHDEAVKLFALAHLKQPDHVDVMQTRQDLSLSFKVLGYVIVGDARALDDLHGDVLVQHLVPRDLNLRKGALSDGKGGENIVPNGN